MTLCRAARHAATEMRSYWVASSASRRATTPLHRQASWVRLAMFDRTGPSAEPYQCILEPRMQSEVRLWYDPSVSHRQHESWQLKVFVSDAFLILPKPALGNRTIAVTCKVTTSAELLNCKLSPKGSQSAGHALPLRQMAIKSAIPRETFLTFTEFIPARLRILRFVVIGGSLIHTPRKTRGSSKGDGGPVHFRKNFRMDWDSQSSAVAADQVSWNPARKRGDPAHFKYWRQQGLSVRAAAAVAAVGCKSVDEIRDRGWHFFERRGNCGSRTLQELSDLVGTWPDAPRRYVAWVRRAPDEVLLEEIRRRGLAVVHGEAA